MLTRVRHPALALLALLLIIPCAGCDLEGLEVAIEPEPLRLDEDLLVVIVTAPPADEDDKDGFSYRYEWSRDGELQDDLTGTTVPWDRLGASELWSVQVTPELGDRSGEPATAEVTLPDSADHDGDGYEGLAGDGADCDDYDASIAPWAGDEPHNGIDDDCDGVIDEPTFEWVQTTVFIASCSCHVTDYPAQLGGLGDYDLAYDNLVDVDAHQAPAVKRVEAGSSADSYLIDKLENTFLEVGGHGQQMPLNAVLTQEVIDGVKAWIDSGAPRD